MGNAKAKFRSRLSTIVPQRLLAVANENDYEWFLKSRRIDVDTEQAHKPTVGCRNEPAAESV